MQKYNKKQLAILTTLLFLIVVAIPLMITHFSKQQIIKSKAALEGTRVEFVDTSGSLIQESTTKNVRLKLTYVLPSPFPSPSPQPSVAPSPLLGNDYTMKVLVIKYFPLTSDGQNIDVTVTGDVGETYTTIKQRTINITNNLVNSLPEASSYLGYKDNSSTPSLNYQVVDTKEYTQAVPMVTDGTRRPDYSKIMTDNSICSYVNQGVSEVWLWAYQGPSYPGGGGAYLSISESKMSGPFGDISNSPRYNDMPQCGKTYRVYTFNYRNGTAEAMESWGHQMEAEMDVVDSGLFRGKFQGPNYPQTLGINGRCGSVHNPPNARFEYDKNNPTSQKSDCLDWNPDGEGTLFDISCQNWTCIESEDPPRKYMIWNWQNLPGRNNTKTYQGKPLRNFWDIHGDFDRVMGFDRTIFASQSSVQGVSIVFAQSASFPANFRVANFESELLNETGQVFDTNPKIIDWTLTEGFGQKTVFVQFKVNEAWESAISASINYISPSPNAFPTPTPSPTSSVVPSTTIPPSLTPTPRPTTTKTPSPTPTSRPSVTPTPFPTPTLTPRPTVTQTSSPTPTINPAIAKYDLNGDGVINSVDIAALIREIRKGPAGWSLQFDFNSDGVLNSFDFAILRKNLGT